MGTIAARDIRVHLKEIIKSSDEKQNMIAAKIGISEGYLSKFLGGKEINFWMVREIVRYLDPKNETELMERHCLRGVKKKNYAPALEYCYTKQLYSVIETLISTQVERDGKIDPWSNIYRFILNSRFSFGNIEYTEGLKVFSPSCEEMKTLLCILEMYGYFYNGRYEITLYHIRSIRSLIESLSDPFLKIAFTARIEEVLVNIYLKQNNDVNKARESAHSLLEKDLSINLNMTALYILALSYMNESYCHSYRYYMRCLELLSKFPDRNEEMTQNKEEIAILQYYWHKEISQEFQVTEFAKALGKSEPLDSFYTDSFYKKYALLFDGKREENAEKLLLSLYYFSQQQDKFRATLPKIHLIKLGFNFNI
ncbi:AimR family lysis-lysogeny pheromone receptor [Bacillus amyloliquefaciens]|uniref:AimR family lysis-lysogeny pheromone receptor n=1 Tax=Bacillus amyloliquefaciens TaxID=1390 RepID=UPI00293F249C|nr:AimR family lysis-lysogeny pheromone receptor [Bacillus amyloliquefaciens]WOH96558.1 AimR family lysis-lysogeny pheromone receptor [Bacillus amyloliquefaciens]WOI51659.1 AimR family lysis-lysogeny pheromone receptor [Bacillus amyloliquefaciens]WOI67476.1 AimR family lysis-lysogeny pheromone receptor [Bacillus amyloliquefaciens]